MALTFRLQVSPPTMSADGVHLQRLGGQHLGLLIKASRDPEIVRWTFIPPELDKTGAVTLVERWRSRATDGRLRQYAISAEQSMPAVGVVSLILQDPTNAWLADIAYWLLPEGRRRGLVTRAVRLVLNWAFEESNVPRVALYTMEGNQPSERVAVRCGFRYTETIQRQRGEQALALRQWLLEREEHQIRTDAGH